VTKIQIKIEDAVNADTVGTSTNYFEIQW
jgi:hypothetical protein